MHKLIVKTLTVGQLQSNCYLVIDTKSKKCLIIDPGDDADYIIRIIQDEKIKPIMILATHGHFDHILGVTELQLAYKIPFYMSKKDIFLVNRVQETAKYFTGIRADPPPMAKCFSKIKLGKYNFCVIETPGHTPGGVCFYQKEYKILFTGDTIFAKGLVGRTDFSYCSNNDLQKSLEKISKLPKQTVIYPGHGSLTYL